MRPMYEAASILIEGTNDSINDAMVILEDATSPINKRYREKLYQTIVDRAHVDFGDIPNSKGDIIRYSGYKTMLDTLNALVGLGQNEKSKELVDYATVVLTTIDNIKKSKPFYTKAFTQKNKYIMLDYNLYVYTCVQATTSLITAFVSDLKTDSSKMKIELKDTKYGANLFYIDSLRSFNDINKDGKYSKYMDSVLKNGKENMILDTSIVVGAAAIAIVAFSIIPLTRKLIYCFKELRRKLSNTLAEQAYFLELNKNCLEYNTTMDEKKKQKILKRQEKLRNVLLSLSDKIKIDDVKAQQQSSRELQRDNKEMTIDGIRDEISDSDITIV